MKLRIGYGHTPQEVDIPDGRLAGVLAPNAPPPGPRGAAALRRALDAPLGTGRLAEIVRPGERVAIITSDITRPLPTADIMPALLDELYAAGVRREDVTLVFALGSHRRHSPEEMARLAGPRAVAEIACVDADPADCVHLGVTEAGTPVDVTRVVARADRRICLGNVEYHYFAGYSGGAKAIMPGCSTRAAIQANHSRMVLPGAAAGVLDGNPVRADLEEAVKFCPIDFLLNVVLDEHKRIIHAQAGDFIEAHRAACRFLDGMYKVEIERRADIVLVSQGGAPKDLNLYQTQKALDNAAHAVKPGGIVVLVGSCSEGMGEEVFERWMRDAKTPAELIERIVQDFQLGGHKAAAIAMVLREAQIFLVSEMAPDFVRSLFLRPFADVQQALDAALAEQLPDCTVLAMPWGGSTLPVVRGRE